MQIKKLTVQIFSKVAGHSLGGALAAIGAEYIYSDVTLKDSSRIFLSTIGQPRTGDNLFANSVTTKVCKVCSLLITKLNSSKYSFILIQINVFSSHILHTEL